MREEVLLLLDGREAWRDEHGRWRESGNGRFIAAAEIERVGDCASLAGSDDGPAGFEAFYRLVFGRELPSHAKAEWIPAIYEGKRKGLGTVIEAFRGSCKTTTLTIAWVAFRVGHHPEKSNLLLQVGDNIARDNAQQIADIIDYNEGWKRVFPHVAPDRKAGWSSTGYEVMRTDMDYAEWRGLCALEKGKDPTFVGLGYRSRAVIGKHPTGVLVVDDIHDENNTRSARELETVRKIVMGTILPTVTPDTWQVFVGTPWTANDVLAYLKSTGRFISIRTPIMRSTDVIGSANGVRDGDEKGKGDGSEREGRSGSSPILHGTGEKGHTKSKGRNMTGRTSIMKSDSQVVASSHSQVKAKKEPSNYKTTKLSDYVPTWPERFPLEEIKKLRKTTGEVEFARMFLLDLAAASGVYLRRAWLGKYPHEKVDNSWPVIMGVDYASTADKLVDGRRDYFAVAIGRALPGGSGIVLVDGYRGHVSQGEAEATLKKLAGAYPNTQLIGVEAVGKGEEFFHLMLRISRLPVRAVRPGRESKGERFERGMAPLFEFHRAWVVDVDTAFTQAFEEEWVRWPHGEHDDTLDAVYWMLYVGVPHLIGNGRKGKPLSANPFGAFARA
jgi:hypothetical protein